MARGVVRGEGRGADGVKEMRRHGASSHDTVQIIERVRLYPAGCSFLT